MAYRDYGAFVFRNDKRRTDKEDVPAFDGEITVDTSAFDKEMEQDWGEWVVYEEHHGIIGDGNIRVMCHKQNPPVVLELTDGVVKQIQLPAEKFISEECGTKWSFAFDYKGHHFFFESGTGRENPCTAEMTEPDGTHWLCEYDYFYGAGFEWLDEEGEQNE